MERVLPVPDYIYGTMSLGNDQVPFSQRVAMARYAMDRCGWFHTSHKYGSTLDVLREAFRQDPGRIPRCTFKLSGDSLDEVKGQIVQQLAAVGVESMGLGQLHLGGELARDFAAGGPSLDGLRALREEGLVAGWVLEVHPWTSQIALEHLRSGRGSDVIDGFTFYYNPLQRYALNDLFALVLERKTPILALRTLAGGPVEQQAARPVAADDFLGQRARELLPLYRDSGFADWVDFCLAYVHHQAGVVTSIGAASTPAHLDALLAGVQQKNRPFEAELSWQIAALQTRWSDEKDRYAPEWSM